MKKEGHPQLSGDIFFRDGWPGANRRYRCRNNRTEDSIWIMDISLPTPSHLRSGFLNPSKTSSGNSLHFYFTFFPTLLVRNNLKLTPNPNHKLISPTLTHLL